VPKYGISYIGDNLTQGQMNAVTDAVNLARFRFKWSQVEAVPGVYDFDFCFNQIKIAVDAGKKVWLQFLIGGNTKPSKYISPSWLFSAPYNVPEVYTTTSGENLFYPYYFNATFETRHRAFLDKVFEWIAAMPSQYRDAIVLFLSSEGKTGDPGPYNGTPTNPIYVISNDDWNTHKYDLWDYQKSRIAFHGLTGLTFMINPGNDGENLQKGLDDYAPVSFKAGDNSHNFDFSGSKNLGQRYAAFRDPALGGDYEYITGGEFENTDELFYYTNNPKGYLLPFIGFNLAAGTSIINIAPNALITDRFAYDLFNEFAQYRNISESERGILFF